MQWNNVPKKGIMLHQEQRTPLLLEREVSICMGCLYLLCGFCRMWAQIWKESLLTMVMSKISTGKKISLLPVLRKTCGEACCAIYLVDFSEECSLKKSQLIYVLDIFLFTGNSPK